MNKKLASPQTIDELLDCADRMASDYETKYSGDLKLIPAIAVDLCRLLANSLDDEQRSAVAAAHAHLLHEPPTEYARLMSEFAERIDADQRERVTGTRAALNRLVWTALNRNTKFSSFAVDFVVGLAIDNGLGVEQIYGVLRNRIGMRL